MGIEPQDQEPSRPNLPPKGYKRPPLVGPLDIEAEVREEMLRKNQTGEQPQFSSPGLEEEKTDAQRLAERERKIMDKVIGCISENAGYTLIEREGEETGFITRKTDGTIFFSVWNKKELQGYGQGGDIQLAYYQDSNMNPNIEISGVETNLVLQVGTSTEKETRKRHGFDEHPPKPFQISMVHTDYFFNSDGQHAKVESDLIGNVEYSNEKGKQRPQKLPLNDGDFELAGGALGILESIAENELKKDNTKFIPQSS